MVTLTAYDVQTFANRMIESGEGDLIDALLHLKSETGIATLQLLWLYAGKTSTVTR